MKRGFHTKAVHAGEAPRREGALITPIYQTVTFTFKTVEEAKRAIELSLDKEEPGYAYTRFSNPTHIALEKKVASLEGGEAALATATGMAAIATAIFALMKKGDHLISARGIYASTHSLFSKLDLWGIDVSFIDQTKPAEIAAKIKANTKLIFLETPSNPLLQLADIREIATQVKRNGAKVMVDNTFATPYYQHPLNLGADIVMHSATKYLSGHLDTMGGIIVGGKDFIQSCAETLTLMGGITNPFNAWLIVRGTKTLPIRMEKHSQNALTLARWLESQNKVERVFYPGLPSHPQHELARRQMTGFGGMVSFEVAGGEEGARKLLENIKLCSLAVSLGGPETLLEHPATMSHLKMSPEERAALGISGGLIRMSVGLEDSGDLIEDLSSALHHV
ncbi:MAG: trans-sulfuration enzyme family protein [Dehalococcoidales bacterium]